MTELKTLKDLRFIEEKTGLDIVSGESIKQEAIKWAKRFDYRNEEIKESGNLATSWEYHWNHITIDFIKKFFNITEEELK